MIKNIVFGMLCLALLISIFLNWRWYYLIDENKLVNRNLLIIDGISLQEYTARNENWRRDVANVINYNLNQKVLKEPPGSVKR